MFNRRFSIGSALHGALAMFGAAMALPKAPPLPPHLLNPEATYKKKYGKSKRRGRSGQKGARDRLVLDRSNSVHKLQRWLNNGSLEVNLKGDAHWKRHKVRRIEQQRIQNAARLAAE